MVLPLKEITQAEIKDLGSADMSQLEDAFSLDRGDIESFSYVKSEDIMNVREILVIKVKAGVDAKKIAEAVDKAAAFKSYKSVTKEELGHSAKYIHIESTAWTLVVNTALLLVFFAFICWREKDLVKGVMNVVNSKILKKK